jgi:hypothetical protein
MTQRNGKIYHQENRKNGHEILAMAKLHDEVGCKILAMTRFHYESEWQNHGRDRIALPI